MGTRVKEGEVDEEGIEPKDIELVVSQVNCSRAKAVEALRSWVAVTTLYAHVRTAWHKARSMGKGKPKRSSLAPVKSRKSLGCVEAVHRKVTTRMTSSRPVQCKDANEMLMLATIFLTAFLDWGYLQTLQAPSLISGNYAAFLQLSENQPAREKAELLSKF